MSRGLRLARFVGGLLLVAVAVDWITDPAAVAAPLDQMLAGLTLALGAGVACGASVDLAVTS